MQKDGIILFNPKNQFLNHKKNTRVGKAISLLNKMKNTKMIDILQRTLTTSLVPLGFHKKLEFQPHWNCCYQADCKMETKTLTEITCNLMAQGNFPFSRQGKNPLEPLENSA